MPAAVAFRWGGIALGAIIALVLTYPFSRNMTATYAAHTSSSLLWRSKTDSSAHLHGSSHQSIASCMQASAPTQWSPQHPVPTASKRIADQPGRRQGDVQVEQRRQRQHQQPKRQHRPLAAQRQALHPRQQPPRQIRKQPHKEEPLHRCSNGCTSAMRSHTTEMSKRA
jgi:hypothetical protein